MIIEPSVNFNKLEEVVVLLESQIKTTKVDIKLSEPSKEKSKKEVIK